MRDEWTGRWNPAVRRGAVLAGLVLLLVLRGGIGPWALPPLPSGGVAICAGAELVFVDPRTGQPVDAPEVTKSVPCPFTLAAQALTLPAPDADPTPTGPELLRTPRRAMPPLLQRPPPAFRPRAPPAAA